MGKSWKENPYKWKHNKGFQKKQKHKNRGKLPPPSTDDMDVDPQRIQDWNYNEPVDPEGLTS